MSESKLEFSDSLSDSEDSSEESYEPNKDDKNNENNYKQNIEDNGYSISVNGMKENELVNIPYETRIMFVQCDYCAKFYNKDMIAQQYDEGSQVCFHCLYWLNYKPELRPFVDGVFGKSIVEYIMETRDSHDIAECDKRTTGGCIVCDHLDGLVLEGVANNELLINDNPYDSEKSNGCDDDKIKITI